MNFLLSGGLGPGNQVVVDPSVIGSTWELSMISDMRFEELRLPGDPVSHVMQGYNMGWMTANYRGRCHRPLVPLSQASASFLT